MMKAYNVTQKRLEARKWFEICLIVSLALHVVVLQSNKSILLKVKKLDVPILGPDVIDVAVTKQEKVKPAPPRPAYAIPVENDLFPEYEDIPIGTVWEPDTYVPPPLQEELTNEPGFVVFDQAPKPIGGFSAIMANLEYPEMARKANVEGRVVVYAQIGATGDVIDTKIMQSLGPIGCDEAAIKAIKSVRWHPALQRDRPVSVWISIPVDFKLK